MTINSTAKNGKSIVEEKILILESNFEHFFLYFNIMLKEVATFAINGYGGNSHAEFFLLLPS